MGIRAYIPAYGQYESGREGFTYEPKENRWKFPNNKYLTFRKIRTAAKGNKFRLYFTRRSECKNCPFKQHCIGKQHECRLMTTIYKEYYDRTTKRVKSSFGKRMKYLRQSNIEPVFGSLINFYGMSKVNTRGIDLAHKCMLMAAIAYNIRKYMRHSPRIVNLMAGSVNVSCNLYSDGFLNAFLSIISCLMFNRNNLAIIQPTRY